MNELQNERKKKKYAFYISRRSGRLLKFINEAESEILKQIKLVISDYEIVDELKNLLIEKSIKFVVIDFLKLDGKDNKSKNRILSDAILKYLDMENVDYCFSFGSHLLSGELLKKYKNRLINFHPSILPMYPGKKSIDQAVSHGNTFLVGNTVHFIDEGMDTGDIIMQSVIPIQSFLENNDYDIVLDLQVEMLNQLIDILNDNRLIIDGKPLIKNADYKKGIIFPKV